MSEAEAVGEDVELVGGPLDGQIIRYAAGDAPRRFLIFGAGRPREGPRCIYERTADRTAAGATIFLLTPPVGAAGPEGSA